jgi:hypothetical protein
LCLRFNELLDIGVFALPNFAESVSASGNIHKLAGRYDFNVWGRMCIASSVFSGGLVMADHLFKKWAGQSRGIAP